VVVMPSHFRFQRRRLSLAYGAFYTFAFAVEVAVLTFVSTHGTMDPWAPVVSGIVALGLALCGVRAFRMATIEGDAGGVTIRSFLWTRRLSWDQVARVEGLPCRIGLSGRRGVTPVLRLVHGRRVRLGEFFLTNHARELDPARKVPLALAQHVGPQMSPSAHDPVWPLPGSVSTRG
jgi:hypothetical protein